MPRKPRLSLNDLEQEAEKFRAPATEKERSIIAAAVELFGERGVDGATTAEIARRAGVTEKTLFRYFPSKRDLIRRVLFPLLLRGGLTREWEEFERLLEARPSTLKDWYAAFTARRLAAVAQDPALVRTLLVELVQNEELREATAALWRQHIWRPMVEGLRQMQASGTLRKEIDAETLARAIHCLNVGYFFVRHVFAPDGKWDDVDETEKMAELLARGSDVSRGEGGA